MPRKHFTNGDLHFERERRRCLDTLGLHRDATPDQIISRYRELAFANHPDRYPGDAARAHRFRDVAKAYSFLMRGESGDRGRPPAMDVDDPYARLWWDKWGDLYPPREEVKDTTIRLGHSVRQSADNRPTDARVKKESESSDAAAISRSPRLTSFSHGSG